ncbi:MAG TPA: GNAT family N-acetyltransferase [Gemmatimonadaceae bacterium]
MRDAERGRRSAPSTWARALDDTDPDLRFAVPLEVRIRLCREDDLPRLEWFGMFTAFREIIGEAFDRQRAGDNLMLVADANDFPVAQAWIDLERLRPERAGMLWAVRVFPCFQGLGIGSRLITAAERVLRRLGLVEAEIRVEKHNAGARRLYERLGYEVMREEREAYDYATPEGVAVHAEVDEWVMRKRIARDAGARAPRPVSEGGAAR